MADSGPISVSCHRLPASYQFSSSSHSVYIVSFSLKVISNEEGFWLLHKNTTDHLPILRNHPVISSIYNEHPQK